MEVLTLWGTRLSLLYQSSIELEVSNAQIMKVLRDYKNCTGCLEYIRIDVSQTMVDGRCGLLGGTVVGQRRLRMRGFVCRDGSTSDLSTCPAEHGCLGPIFFGGSEWILIETFLWMFVDDVEFLITLTQ